ncbi:MAG: hypothetical protein DRH43_05255 [Deltaproteobacteria bacterium]|nr:MAG: hypothetical protein DRH43_05255 [Deltaproteobacteria bacterium]
MQCSGQDSSLAMHYLRTGKRPRPGKGGFEAAKTFRVPVYDGPGPEKILCRDRSKSESTMFVWKYI